MGIPWTALWIIAAIQTRIHSREVTSIEITDGPDRNNLGDVIKMRLGSTYSCKLLDPSCIVIRYCPVTSGTYSSDGTIITYKPVIAQKIECNRTSKHKLKFWVFKEIHVETGRFFHEPLDDLYTLDLDDPANRTVDAYYTNSLSVSLNDTGAYLSGLPRWETGNKTFEISFWIDDKWRFKMSIVMVVKSVACPGREKIIEILPKNVTQESDDSYKSNLEAMRCVSTILGNPLGNVCFVDILKPRQRYAVSVTKVIDVMRVDHGACSRYSLKNGMTTPSPTSTVTTSTQATTVTESTTPRTQTVPTSMSDWGNSDMSSGEHKLVLIGTSLLIFGMLAALCTALCTLEQRRRRARTTKSNLHAEAIEAIKCDLNISFEHHCEKPVSFPG